MLLGGPISTLLDKRVILVTGKGGVGRTTLSAALAFAQARLGKRVVLTEIGDPDSDFTALARVFGRDTLPAEEVEVAKGIQGCVLWPRTGHERFFETVLPSKTLVKAAMGSGALRRLMDSAPSFREMGIFYHFLTLLEAKRNNEKNRYDAIIVDMPASGHTLGLTGLPERLLTLLPTGPIADAMRRGQAIMHDPTECGATVVTLPEVLPVTETLELVAGLEETRVPVAAILANRVLRDPFTKAERKALEPLSDAIVYGMNRFNSIPQVAVSLERLRQSTGLPIIEVEEVAAAGRDLIDAIAEQLVENQ